VEGAGRINCICEQLRRRVGGGTRRVVVLGCIDTFPKPNQTTLVGDENKIAAIIGINRSSQFVGEIMELLYGRAFRSAHWAAYYANCSKRVMPAKRIGGLCLELACGESSLFLHGRRVSDLVTKLEHGEQYERVQWTEPDSLNLRPDNGYRLELVKKGRHKKIRRRTSPIDISLFGQQTK